MDASLRNKLVDVLSSSNLKKEDATFVADVLQEIDTRKYSNLLTQVDKIELVNKMNEIHLSLTTKLYVTVFAVGLVQILAIIGAVLAIINAGRAS